MSEGMSPAATKAIRQMCWKAFFRGMLIWAPMPSVRELMDEFEKRVATDRTKRSKA